MKHTIGYLLRAVLCYIRTLWVQCAGIFVNLRFVKVVFRVGWTSHSGWL